MAAPTYFGSASVPADGASATNATGTLTITPPGSMQAGDLVVVVTQSRNAATWSVGVSGGQSWTAEKVDDNGLFWCRFNGTWAANPRFDSTSSTCTTAVMHVFRPDNASKQWAVDVALSSTPYTAPSSPFTVTRTGLTTVHADTVTLAGWDTQDDNTWGSLSGAGWAVTGSAQYRNTAGQDQSASFAHYLAASAGTAVPNVSKNQLTLGGDAGSVGIITWYAALITSLSDATGLGETFSRVVAFSRSLPDALSIGEVTDFAMPHAGYYALLTEAGGFLTAEEGHRLLLEEVSAGAALTKNLSDGLTLSDSRSGAAGFARAQADALALADALAKILTWRRSLADALALSDATAKALALARSYSDPLTLSENVAKALTIIRSYSDAIALGETFAKQIVLARSFADSMSLGEAIAKALILTRSLSEPLTLGENLLRNALFSRLRTEAIALGEAFSKVANFARSPQDPLMLGESIKRGFGRPLADPIVLGESVARLFVLVRSFADALTLSDAVTKFISLGRAMSDPIALGELLGRVLTFRRSLADFLVLGELLTRAAGFKRSLADPLTLAELLARAAGYKRSTTEPIALADVINVVKIGPAFRSAWARRTHNLGTGVAS